MIFSEKSELNLKFFVLNSALIRFNNRTSFIVPWNVIIIIIIINYILNGFEYVIE